MKLIRCRPAEGKGCKGEYAMLPDGTPQRLGRAPDFRSREPHRVKCHRCGRVTPIRAEDYARLPEATLKDLRELGLGWMVENDLRGMGAEDEHIEALEQEKSLDAGVTKLRATLSAATRAS